MKIVFLGSGAFGLPTLRALAAPGSGHEVVGVVTQPDRPAGRGGKVAPTPVGAWAAEHLAGGAAPLLKPESVNEVEVVARIRALGGGGPEACTAGDVAWVVIAYGQKLSRELVEGVFAVNLHGSLLPRWRGAAPINHAILAGDEVSGNSVITIADRMDAGLVLGQSRRAIDPLMTAGELHDALAGDGPDVVSRVLQERERGTLRPVEQDESLVTKAGKLSRADGWVDFSQGAEECRRRVHGLTPWPGVAVEFRGRPVKLCRVKEVALYPPHGGQADSGLPPHLSYQRMPWNRWSSLSRRVPGAILEEESGIILCGDFDDTDADLPSLAHLPRRPEGLRVLELQPAGKRVMSWTEFANGFHVQRGEVFVGRRRC